MSNRTETIEKIRDLVLTLDREKLQPMREEESMTDKRATRAVYLLSRLAIRIDEQIDKLEDSKVLAMMLRDNVRQAQGAFTVLFYFGEGEMTFGGPTDRVATAGFSLWNDAVRKAMMLR